MADFAPVVEGHVLICPENHVTSFANADPELRRDAFDLAETIGARFRARGQSCVIAEHGTGETGGPSNACCDHAHLHVVPLNLPVTEQALLNLYGEYGGAPIHLRSSDDFAQFRNKPYNMLKFRAGAFNIWPRIQDFYPQFFRNRFCLALGYPPEDPRFLWQASIDKRLATKTAAIVGGMFEDLGARQIRKWREVGKLVRDGVPALISSMGEYPVYREIRGAELQLAASAKLQEELEEYFDSPSNREAEDVYDILAFLLKLGGYEGPDPVGQTSKRKEVGGFDRGIFLEVIVS
jgi:predicted house-cleaning noncanonical NTP pyrophosphatase (MazG superfamily)